MDTKEASDKILSGELVVFPTETVYGLGALASDDVAVKRIFEVKGRPQHNPLILHIADNEQLDDLVSETPNSAKILIDNFWPGPLTICFKKSDKVSDLVTANLETVCIRRPSDMMTNEFLSQVSSAVAAPSANLSGRPSTTTFLDSRKQLENEGVYFLEGGESALGLESTIVDCSEDTPKILRPGSISKEDLEDALGQIILDKNSTNLITSPGQLLSHYSPAGNLTVIIGELEQRRNWLRENSTDYDSSSLIGVLGTTEDIDFAGESFIMADSDEDLVTYATNLYKFLNKADRDGNDQILLELGISQDPLRNSLIDRLEKASKGRLIYL